MSERVFFLIHNFLDVLIYMDIMGSQSKRKYRCENIKSPLSPLIRPSLLSAPSLLRQHLWMRHATKRWRDWRASLQAGHINQRITSHSLKLAGENFRNKSRGWVAVLDRKLELSNVVFLALKINSRESLCCRKHLQGNWAARAHLKASKEGKWQRLP